MHQLRLLNTSDLNRVVNVASVPQRSPFRYPGGKTWLVPRIRIWLDSLPAKPSLFIEPFAGGGIVSLSVASENLAERILMVEIDEQMASVWQVMLNGDAEWLANRIFNFELNRESLMRELSKSENNIKEKAFHTLLRNRTSHGGILAPGAGVIKFGENGKGISSRWYPQTLAKRILDIGKISDKIEFVMGDGLEVIKQYKSNADAVFFIDPPYTAAGKKAGRRLYTHNELDHEELFTLAGAINGNFLMTYDNAEGVRELATRHKFQVAEVAMNNTHHAKMDELLISKNLEWLFKT